MHKHLILTTILSLALSACSLTPAYLQPQMDIPENWSVVSDPALSSQQKGPPFWQAFENEELNRVIEVALAQNLDLQAALYRIEQARAQAKVMCAALLPSLDVNGEASRRYQDTQRETPWQGLTTLSYELDLWGKN